jgi:hypothetical protein
MFVTLVFYLGAANNRSTTALQHSNNRIANLFSRGLSGPVGLFDSLAAGGCFKHLIFFSKFPQTVLFFIWVKMFKYASMPALAVSLEKKSAGQRGGCSW